MIQQEEIDALLKRSTLTLLQRNRIRREIEAIWDDQGGLAGAQEAGLAVVQLLEDSADPRGLITVAVAAIDALKCVITEMQDRLLRQGEK